MAALLVWFQSLGYGFTVPLYGRPLCTLVYGPVFFSSLRYSFRSSPRRYCKATGGNFYFFKMLVHQSLLRICAQ
jgi:hypothetical protein